jgi:hypothetical protein
MADIQTQCAQHTLRRTKAKHELHIATLIVNLSRSVDILAADIEQEEARAGSRNVADLAYPVLARLRVRKEIIKETIVATSVQGAPKAA